MKRAVGTISAIILLLLLCSGVFADFIRFFAWLFTLQHSAPETSVAGGIAVRCLTFFASYAIVGVAFSFLGWFDSKAMSLAYFIISSLLGFALAYVVWTIETHLLVIGIVLSVVFGLALLILVIGLVVRRKKGTKDQNA